MKKQEYYFREEKILNGSVKTRVGSAHAREDNKQQFVLVLRDRDGWHVTVRNGKRCAQYRMQKDSEGHYEPRTDFVDADEKMQQALDFAVAGYFESAWHIMRCDDGKT